LEYDVSTVYFTTSVKHCIGDEFVFRDMRYDREALILIRRARPLMHHPKNHPFEIAAWV